MKEQKLSRKEERDRPFSPPGRRRRNLGISQILRRYEIAARRSAAEAVLPSREYNLYRNAIICSGRGVDSSSSLWRILWSWLCSLNSRSLLASVAFVIETTQLSFNREASEYSQAFVSGLGLFLPLLRSLLRSRVRCCCCTRC